jgi:hypothetical protein
MDIVIPNRLGGGKEERHAIQIGEDAAAALAKNFHGGSELNSNCSA